jgi:NTP pyrophosphatase (non-canonical NTP hydrolase)
MSEFHILKSEVDAFVNERDWGIFHTPKNLAMCLSVEASELLELYQWQIWQTTEIAPGGGPPDQTRVAEEVGDIMISLLNFCRAAGIDPISAARNKLLEVKEKYPVAKVRGSAVRPANKT